MIVFDAFLWFSQDPTNQMRYPFVRTEIWYLWTMLSWSHVPINLFAMTFGRSRSVMHGGFWSDFLKLKKMLTFWNWLLLWASGNVRIEFAAEKCVRTILLNIVFIIFCVFCRFMMLGCLSWCFLISDTVSTSRPHRNNGRRFTVRSQFFLFLFFIFLIFLISCHRHRPCGPHFLHLKNFLGAIRRTKPFFNVITRKWQSLVEIHLADLKLWPTTCHHVADFLFDQNFASSPRRKSIACSFYRFK